MASNTSQEFDEVISGCRDIFTNKNKDYGTAWRILRLPSITDQIFIKAQRIRSLEEKGESKVGEGIEPEFMGIINYCVIGLIQLELKDDSEVDIPANKLLDLYNKEIQITKDLMEAKNHDYGEAWRDMRPSTFTDLILMKLLRTKQIEDNKGKTIISEGIDANLRDMINYSIFALIRLKETK